LLKERDEFLDCGFIETFVGVDFVFDSSSVLLEGDYFHDVPCMFITIDAGVGVHVYPQSLGIAGIILRLDGGFGSPPRSCLCGLWIAGDGIGGPVSTIVVLLGDFIGWNFECFGEALVYIKQSLKGVRAT
jgi:hypothetical protein